MSLIWLTRGKQERVGVSLCLFNLVTGWTQTAAEMRQERDQRPRKTCSHFFQTYSQGIKEVNELRKKCEMTEIWREFPNQHLGTVGILQRCSQSRSKPF